jgi:hypothetical protein
MNGSNERKENTEMAFPSGSYANVDNAKKNSFDLICAISSSTHVGT